MKPFKELCRATGLNQTKFADRIGVPHRTLVLIMAGQRRLMEPMAELIFLHTGALPQSLFGDFDKPLATTGSHTPPTISKTGTRR